jgi:mannan endo-1,4-beta-mannosidase
LKGTSGISNIKISENPLISVLIFFSHYARRYILKFNFLRFIIIIALSYFLTGCSGLFFQKSKAEFIKVENGRFILDGKSYYFVGTNMWYGCYVGSKSAFGDRERLKRELDLLKENNITNLRVLAASEESEIQNSVTPAIQTTPEVYSELLLDGLDFLLSEMRERKMFAVLYLNNYWEWSGGMSQYNAWTNGGKIVDPAKDNAWMDFMNYSATFYNNETANKYYRNYIKYILNRINNYSGIAYKDDPTIMSWQLANEPRPAPDGDHLKNAENFYLWVDETAKYIHSLDTNHLVTTGNEGLAGCLQSEEIYLTAHSSKYVDYITFHLWPKNWGWFDAKRINETYPSTEKKAIDYINKHIDFARRLNKPITLEEFGIARDSEFVVSSSPTTIRDKYFRTIFQLVYDSASSGAPFAGTNFWTWGGEGRGKNDDTRWRTGDPFVGDPLQEPQGLNSVFDSDTSTLNIISFFGKKMKEITNIEQNKNSITENKKLTE